MPHVTIDSADDLGDITEENASQYTISGTCTENNTDVTLTVIGKVAVSPAPSATCGANNQPGKWSANVDLSSRAHFPAGIVSVTADHQKGVGDNALKSVQATRNLVKIPHVGIDLPTGGLPEIDDSNVRAYLLKGDCSEANVDVVVKVGSSGSQDQDKVSDTAQCSKLYKWTLAMDLSDRKKIPTGVNKVTASHTKTMGGGLDDDLTDTSTTLTLTRRPSVTINPVVDMEYGGATGQTISGTCSEDGKAVTLSLSGYQSKVSKSGTISPKSTCVNGEWSYTNLDLSVWDSGHVTATANHASSGDTYTAPAFERILNRLPGVTIAQDSNDLPDIDEDNEGAYYRVHGTCTELGFPVHVWIGNSTGHTHGLCDVSGTQIDRLTPAYKYVVQSTNCLGEILSGTKKPRDLHIFLKGGLLARDNMGSLTTCEGKDTFTRNTEVCTKKEKDKRMELFIGGVLKEVPCQNSLWEVTGWNLDDTIRAKISTGALKVVALHSKTFSDTSFPLIKVTTSTKPFNRKALVSIDAVALADITTGAALDLKGTCSDPGQDVSVTVTAGVEGEGGHTKTKNDITCDNDKTWEWEVDVSNRSHFPTGSISVTANHSTGDTKDSKTGSLSRRPTVTITANSVENITIKNEKAFTLSGTCSDNGGNVLVQVGGHYEEVLCTQAKTYDLEGGSCIQMDGSADIYVENAKNSYSTVTCVERAYPAVSGNSCSENQKKKGTVTAWVGGKLLRTTCSGSGTWGL